jgi:hypothetical protein
MRQTTFLQKKSTIKYLAKPLKFSYMKKINTCGILSGIPRESIPVLKNKINHNVN